MTDHNGLPDVELVTASNVVMGSKEEIVQAIKDQVLALCFDYIETHGKKPSQEWIKLTTTRLYRSYFNKEISRFESV